MTRDRKAPGFSPPHALVSQIEVARPAEATCPAPGPATNPNLLWAETFVNELARSGVQSVCIAPGSRSTPLALAFDAHPALRVYLHLDERSASFFALGLALATGRIVALVCTSGSAAVEFHPAVVEALHSGVPLLVLTADRPPELRHSGANQTIDQVKLYGDHVLWAVDAALPEADPPDVALRNLRTLAARACAAAGGLRKGPVHVNFPFRKPLEPEAPYEPQWQAGPAWTTFARGVLQPTEAQIDWLAGLIDSNPRGLIVAGPRCPGDDFPAALAALARRCAYPILADPLSNVRFGLHVGDAPVLGGYETFLNGAAPAAEPPQVVLRFGAPPTSKGLNDYLERSAPVQQVHIREDGVWADDSHRVRHYVQADPALVCRRLAAAMMERPESGWLEAFLAIEQATQAGQARLLAGEFFDGAAVAAAVAALPAGARLFVGNSLPIRHVDQFAAPLTTPIQVYGNRGASGIDGVTSTALGVAAADPAAPLLLIIGDISFYHDLNGLLAARQHDLRNVAILLLNNDGGNIFRRLPIQRHEPAFSRLFLTPHGLDFEPVVRMYGLDFVRVDDAAGLRRALETVLAACQPTVVEVRSDGRRDHERRLVIIQQIRRKIYG